jgi:nucleotide-binding universal stress UspA family protein
MRRTAHPCQPTLERASNGPPEGSCTTPAPRSIALHDRERWIEPEGGRDERVDRGGIDGSESARLAAQWAAREAQLQDAEVRLVSAWEIPTYGFSVAAVGISDEMMKALQNAAEDNLANATDEVRAIAKEIDVSTDVVEGQAAGVLLEAARDADLLVVGSRGLGGFRELLLGSVSQQCANHAGCPVVIVRHLHPNG